MSQANQSNQTGQNQNSPQRGLDSGLNLRNSFLADLRDEALGMTKDGAQTIRDGFQYTAKFIKELYLNHIHKHIAIVGGVVAAGTVATGTLATLGPSGTATMIGGAAYIALGAGAAVAGIGAVSRVWGWIKDASTVVTGAFKEMIADARSFLGAAAHGVQVMQQDRLQAKDKKLESKVEAQETKLEKEVDAVLARIAKRVNLANQPLVNTLREEASKLLQGLREDKLPQVVKQAREDGIHPRVAHREIGKFQKDLRAELTKNIIRACKEATNLEARKEIIDEKVAALKERINNFKIEKRLKGDEAQTEVAQDEQTSAGTEQSAERGPEVEKILEFLNEPTTAGAHTETDNNPSETQEEIGSLVEKDAQQVETAQPSTGEEHLVEEKETVGHTEMAQAQENSSETAQAAEGAFAKYFGDRGLSSEVEQTLSALTSESTETEKKQAVKLVQKELKHVDVTLEPGDASPVAEVIKRASIPAGRDIPHFDDLYRQLSEKFPKANIELRNENGSEYIAITKGHHTIFLENRHKQLGGKVTVYFQQKVNGQWEDVEQGGMWNDKVEAVVEKFLSSRTGEYPRLKSETASSHRIVDKVLTADQAAKALFSELENESSVKLELRAGGKMTVGATTIFVRREVAGDSRMWKILDADKNVLAEGIAIKDLKEKILAQR
jgi:hypothetical protein